MQRISAALILLSAALGQAQIKVACLGNSITEGFGLPQGALAFPARLGQLLGSGYSVQNDGIGGRTLLYKGDLPYISNNGGKLNDLFNFKPDIITIELGTNDTKPQNWDAHKAEFKGDFLSLLDTLNTLSSKPRIYLMLPPPIWDNAFSIRDSALVKIMVIIKQVAMERGLPIIDTYAPLKTHQALFPDGVHPNEGGADSMAHIVQRVIAGPPAMRFQYASYASTEGSLPFRIFLPENYSRTQKYPLILALHGAGERGNDNQAHIAVHRVAEMWAEDSTQKKQQSFVVAPQCPSNAQWVNVAGWDKVYTNIAQMAQSASLVLAMKMVDSLVKALPVDTNRIYVTGLSMGGYGTWDLVTRFPNRFAAAIPLSGGCDTSKAAAIKHLPVWTFHGALDGTVPPTATRSMVAKFKANGESVVEYTSKYAPFFQNATITRAALTTAIDGGAKKLYGEYTDGGHDIWTQSYNDALVPRWLFKQVKQPGTSAIGTRAARVSGRRSFLVPPGSLTNALAVRLVPGVWYRVSITQVNGARSGMMLMQGGSAVPPAWGGLSGSIRGLAWVTADPLR